MILEEYIGSCGGGGGYSVYIDQCVYAWGGGVLPTWTSVGMPGGGGTPYMDQCRHAWGGGGGVLPTWTSVGMLGGGGGYSLYGPV